MKIVLLLTLNVIGSFGFCPEEFCKSSIKLEESESILIRRDPKGGCICREYSGVYSFCFGQGTCHVFPKDVNITTNQFIIKSTQIVQLKPEDFEHLEHLRILKIEGNGNFSHIIPKTFSNMKLLLQLSISYNDKLKFLEKDTFDGLINLNHLLLIKNGFDNLKAITPSLATLPKIQKLELSENNFQKIANSDFGGLVNSPLQELNLILCQIEDIEAQAFRVLKNLTSLRLGQNNFNATTLAKVIEETKGVPLKLLNLYSIGLRKSSSKELLTVIAKSNISTLYLSRNQFETINSQTFPKMPNLNYLDLKDSLILNISNDAFLNLPNLKTLLLSGNKLTSVPEGVLLEQLSDLDLQLNSVHRSLTTFSIYGNKFINMKHLQRLNLSFNLIYAIYATSFLGLNNLEVLGLKNCSIFNIELDSFSHLTKLLFLNLENNLLVKNNGSILQNPIFDGLSNLQVLLLGGCGIVGVDAKVFKNLHNLQHLGLERNHLVSLPSFENLVYLKGIDLSDNVLKPWSKSRFSKNSHLKMVIISGNKFRTVTDEMIMDFSNLTKLDLRNNPFICDCSFAWNNEFIMNLLENQTIFCAFPEQTTNLTIRQFLQLNTHCQDFTLVIFLTFIVFGLVIFIFSIYYYRWHWRYWLFLTRLHLSRNHRIKKNDVKCYHNYLYDAFVSYSNEDQNFVIRLVTMLENYPPYIRLCVYERDFEVGTMISENVLESVAKSRKTLLVISNSYAKSQWCRWESQIAEHHRLFFQNEDGEYVDDSLILIKLGPVNELHMTPTLRYLLKTRVYLQWDPDESKQKQFWEKLRNVLEPVSENTHL